ncbi:HDOD domain-containing protein [Thiomicrorhabdus sp. 6S2-11]|uniref:HDOD domain-containing protein n=1 Tax=Thiomicrorhabdus marina TaxID=2818442 RepID=A0ABS3Q639_9GAMM|nr:HDOD domain-containing protein [Thiomicrorhabdus marina]MBO1927808.1 HDOD domain-containing protein [Thiomicrorhabdus marina]
MSEASVTKEIVERLAELGDLPHIPDALIRLEKLLSDDSNADIDEIVNLIAMDSRLTAGIIFMANTAKYSLGTQINDLFEAVIRIGLQDVRMLAYAISYQQSFKRKPPFSEERFMQQAMLSALIGQNLAEVCHLNEGEAFLAGLLRDIGVYLLALESRDKYQEVLTKVDFNILKLPVHENKAFGTYHALMSARLLQLWNFSQEVIMGVAYHHIPDKVKGGFSSYAYLTYLTEIGAFKLGVDNGIGEIPPEYWPKVEEKMNVALEKLKVTPEHFQSVLEKSFAEFNHLSPIDSDN